MAAIDALAEDPLPAGCEASQIGSFRVAWDRCVAALWPRNRLLGASCLHCFAPSIRPSESTVKRAQAMPDRDLDRVTSCGMRCCTVTILRRCAVPLCPGRSRCCRMGRGSGGDCHRVAGHVSRQPSRDCRRSGRCEGVLRLTALAEPDRLASRIERLRAAEADGPRRRLQPANGLPLPASSIPLLLELPVECRARHAQRLRGPSHVATETLQGLLEVVHFQLLHVPIVRLQA